jgi:UDP-GlcNAc:undecaprenyl-phosphate/decaprenyl-phosphate GlcNAc-1-phosphate transferase
VPRRANYRGRKVLFPLGIVLLAAAAFTLTAGLNRWLVFLCGVGYLGLLDDLAGGDPRGWRGHGLALARGELSTGAIKAAGTLAFAVYAVSGEGASAAMYVAQVLVLCLAAHLGNLLDTRPGRAEKALALVAAVPCLATWSLAPLAPVAALIPVVGVCAWLTLRERAMLGDTGASLIGGMIGVLLVTTLSPVGVALALATLIAISLYGEFRSICAAVERSLILRRLDRVGRAE